MGETTPAAVYIVAGLVLTLLLVTLGFGIWNSQKDVANNVITETNKMNVAMQEAKFTQYEGSVVTGSEVINIIKNMRDEEIYVEVTPRGGSASIYGYKSTSLEVTNKMTNDEFQEALKKAKTKSDASYINPNGRFLITIDRNADTSAILGMKIEQQ